MDVHLDRYRSRGIGKRLYDYVRDPKRARKGEPTINEIRSIKKTIRKE